MKVSASPVRAPNAPVQRRAAQRTVRCNRLLGASSSKLTALPWRVRLSAMLGDDSAMSPRSIAARGRKLLILRLQTVHLSNLLRRQPNGPTFVRACGRLEDDFCDVAVVRWVDVRRPSRRVRRVHGMRNASPDAPSFDASDCMDPWGWRPLALADCEQLTIA